MDKAAFDRDLAAARHSGRLFRIEHNVQTGGALVVYLSEDEAAQARERTAREKPTTDAQSAEVEASPPLRSRFNREQVILTRTAGDPLRQEAEALEARFKAAGLRK